MSEELGFEVRLNCSYSQALEQVVKALKDQGFGVLTRIDIHATLKEKLGVEFRPYTILGACNPPLAYRALTADAQVGLLLPCNVTVEEEGPDSSLVRIANPAVMMLVGEISQNPDLKSVANDARSRLEQVANSLIIS